MERENKFPFMRRLAAENIPLRLRYELTRRCNLECVHCRVHLEDAPEGELSAVEIARVLEQAREAGTVEISLTGGEVFARPDISDVLRAIFERDFLLHIQTNAVAISGEHIDMLSSNKKKILRVAISLYSADARIHDSITMVPGSHGRTVENIFRLRDAGVPVHCFTLLMRENAAGADALKAFYEDSALPFQFNSVIMPREDGCAGPLARRLPDEVLEGLPINWEDFIDAEDARDDAAKNPDSTLLAINCPAGRFATLTSTGDVLPCSFLRESAGNVRDRDFSDIWMNSEVLKRIRDIRVGQFECFSCDMYPRCKPCMGLAALEHGDPMRRPTEICRLSKIMLKTQP
jgi:AdoMet-dependent heme synthase